ncbi:hypothetical protein YC2023_018471 [Brassica napus]
MSEVASDLFSHFVLSIFNTLQLGRQGRESMLQLYESNVGRFDQVINSRSIYTSDPFCYRVSESGKCTSVVEARLLRFWEARNVKRSGELMWVDMLLDPLT